VHDDPSVEKGLSRALALEKVDNGNAVSLLENGANSEQDSIFGKQKIKRQDPVNNIPSWRVIRSELLKIWKFRV
jgi:hypothetical protein